MNLLVLCLTITCAQLSASVHRAGSKLIGVNNACDDVICAAGRECRFDKLTCECSRSCPRHHAPRPICGSDGRSYPSQCELHRAACTRGDHELRVVRQGRCPHKPVACLAGERQALHARAVASTSDVLATHSCRLAKLTAAHLMRCLRDSRVLRAASKHDKLVEKLCVQSLLEAGDADKDRHLSRDEFTALVQLDFHLPNINNCTVGETIHQEGSETIRNCNKCVCACGRWVCSSAVCQPAAAQRVKHKPGSKNTQDLKVHPHKQRKATAPARKKHHLKLIKSKEWDETE